MAFTLSRIDRVARTYDVTVTDVNGTVLLPATAAVALLPPRAAPTAATVWTSVTVVNGSATVLLAGPDADSTGALVVPASADLWLKSTDAPEVDAEKVERITVLGGGAPLAPATGIPVLSINGKTGSTLVLSAADVGAATPTDLTNGLATKVNTSTYTAGLAGKQDAATLAAATAAQVSNGSVLDVALRAASGAQAADVASPLRTELSKTFAPVADPLRPRPLPPRAQPEWITMFQPGHGFVGTLGTTFADYTADYAFGTQSVRLTIDPAATTARISRLAAAPVDITDKSIVVWIKSPDIAKLSVIELYMGHGNLANYYRMITWTDAAEKPTTNDRWTPIVFSLERKANNAGTPVTSNITDIRLAFTSTSAGGLDVLVGGIGLVPTPRALFPRGVVTFSFDDGFDSVFIEGRPRMDKYGYPGVFYLIADWVDGPGKVTLAQCKQLQERHGWEIGAHAATDSDHNARLTGLTPEQVDQDLLITKTWLRSNGFRSDSYCYPGGEQRSSDIDIVGRYFNTAVDTADQQKWNLLNYFDPLMLTRVSAGTAGANSAITDAATFGLWTILYMHKVGPGGISLVDFEATVELCHTAGVEVLTVEQVLNRLRAGIPAPRSFDGGRL